MPKTWFITGTSRGFGRLWAEAALERGDRVAATARDKSSLKDLSESYGDAVLPLALDVTDRAAAFAVVKQAAEHFGSLDVVINNAGYGHFGYVEEITEEEIRGQLETNVFGALWVTQAALPIMREQGSGHILQVSSVGGVVGFPGIGAYHASKWALEGFTESLAQEVKGFGINVTLIEPGGYSTDWAGSSAQHSDEHPAYAQMHAASKKAQAGRQRPGPEQSTAAVLKVIDAAEPPRRILLSNQAFDNATAAYADRLKIWNDWEETSRAAGSRRP